MTCVSRVAVVTVLVMVVRLAQAQSASTATIPRTADGRPNLSGFWQVLNSASFDLQGHSASLGVPAGMSVIERDEIPYLPEALAKKHQNEAAKDTADPLLKCYLPGTPRIMYMPFPFQIFQTPKQIGMLFEYVHAVRTVYVGTPHPSGHLDYWLGDSRGRWEGDTLVVDVVDFNDETWFDRSGNYHSDAMHLVERISFIDADHLNYEVTVEDAKVFSRPWTMRMVLYRRKEPGFQLLEYECNAMTKPSYAR